MKRFSPCFEHWHELEFKQREKKIYEGGMRYASSKQSWSNVVWLTIISVLSLQGSFPKVHRARGTIHLL